MTSQQEHDDSEEYCDCADNKMNWPSAITNIAVILGIVAIVFIICGNDILKGWLT